MPSTAWDSNEAMESGDVDEAILNDMRGVLCYAIRRFTHCWDERASF